jgi:hypothetical protein
VLAILANTVLGWDAIAKAIEQDRNTVVLKDFKGDPMKQVIFDPATGQWHDSETGATFDPDKWQRVQDQAAKDAAWSQADLDKMAAHQDSFSKNLDQIAKDGKIKEAQLNYLGKLNEMAFDTFLTDLGGPHDVFVTTQKMMDDILDGKTVTPNDVSKSLPGSDSSLSDRARSRNRRLEALRPDRCRQGDLRRRSPRCHQGGAKPLRPSSRWTVWPRSGAPDSRAIPPVSLCYVGPGWDCLRHQ